jgi:hypothetical protein
MIITIASISLISVSNKGKVDYGGRCYQSFDDSFVETYGYLGIELKDNKLVCNTYYLEYESVLNERENILFLNSISKLFYDNSIDCNIHIILKTNQFLILSTIIDYKVSYTTTTI